jgi:hypothetical protein
LLIAFAVLFPFAALPAFTILKGLTFSKKKLERPNPTSCTFDAPVSAVRIAVDAPFASRKTDTRQYGYWKPSGRDAHLAFDTEYNLHQVSSSEIYHWWRTPLEYHADFKLTLTRVTDSRTRVDVQTSDTMVRISRNFSAHGGDYFESVAPTTIEEYRTLLEIGAALGWQGMPPLLLPL